MHVENGTKALLLYVIVANQQLTTGATDVINAQIGSFCYPVMWYFYSNS